MRWTARAPSWINMAIGIWLLLSPWLLGFDEAGRPSSSAAIIGLAITMVAAAAGGRAVRIGGMAGTRDWRGWIATA